MDVKCLCCGHGMGCWAVGPWPVVATAHVVVLWRLAIRYHLTPASNKDVSDAHPTAFTPAGYAFAIWGIIYTFGGVFTVSGRVDAAAMGGLSGLFGASWGPRFWK